MSTSVNLYGGQIGGNIATAGGQTPNTQGSNMKHKLTDSQVKSAKPKDKPYKITDGQAMYLEIRPNGSKVFMLKYRLNGKESRYSLGPYPRTTLAKARAKADEARQQLADGIKPGTKTEVEKPITFEEMAWEWHEYQKVKWSDGHADAVARRVQRFLPSLKGCLLTEVTTPQLAEIFKAKAKKGVYDQTIRQLQEVTAIYSYAVQTGKASINPARELRGLIQRPPTKNRPSIRPEELSTFYKAFQAYNGHPTTKLGLEFLMLTMVRPGEQRKARWEEIDHERKQWVIPAEKMKMRREHVVPLSNQAVDILKQLWALNGRSEWIFPQQSNDHKHMSENAITYSLYRMGYHSRACAHGFRSLASTVLNEKGFNPDWIERQLAHVPSNAIRGAYNRAEYLADRREMLQWWADYLDRKAGKNIRQLKTA